MIIYIVIFIMLIVIIIIIVIILIGIVIITNKLCITPAAAQAAASWHAIQDKGLQRVIIS